MTTKTVLGPKGTSQPPYGSFAGKSPFTPADSKNFVRNFTVLGLGGYSRRIWNSFAGKTPQVNIPPVVADGTILTNRRGIGAPGFTRREYDEFLKAKHAALAKARLLKKKPAKELRKAVEWASEAAAKAGLLGTIGPSLEPLIEALQEASHANAAELAAAAMDAVRVAQMLLEQMDDDEDDVMLLLST
jgi:hypothetical protein